MKNAPLLFPVVRNALDTFLNPRSSPFLHVSCVTQQFPCKSKHVFAEKTPKIPVKRKSVEKTESVMYAYKTVKYDTHTIFVEITKHEVRKSRIAVNITT